MNTDISPNIIAAPELDTSQRLGQLPERLQTAFDARETEQTMREQLVQEWLQALRPELERLAREVVERHAQAYWLAQSSRSDLT